MVETLIAFRQRRLIARGQHRMKFHRHQRGVSHFPFCLARMHIDPVKANIRPRCVEGLAVQFRNISPVNGISEGGIQALQGEQRRAVADLLIRRKADFNPAVRDSRTDQVLTCSQDFGNPGFIVRSQDGSPVGCHQSMADAAGKIRKHLRIQHAAAVAQCHRTTLIVPDQLRFYPESRIILIGYGIKMRDKRDCRHALQARRCRQRSVYIGVVIHGDPGKSHTGHLLFQQFGKVSLPLGGRRAFPYLRTRGMDLHILKQAFKCPHPVSFPVGRQNSLSLAVLCNAGF